MCRSWVHISHVASKVVLLYWSERLVWGEALVEPPGKKAGVGQSPSDTGLYLCLPLEAVSSFKELRQRNIPKTKEF